MPHPTPDTLALLALGEDADVDIATHVEMCETCAAEVESLRHLVTVARSTTAEDVLVDPPARVWQRIRAEISRSGADGHTLDARPAQVPLVARPSRAIDEPRPAAVALDPARSERLRRRRWVPVTLAAALALIAGLGGGLAISRALTPETETVGVTQLNALPGWSGANGTAVVEEDDRGTRTLVVTVELPQDKPVVGTMEVWLSDSRAYDMVTMGKMTGTAGRFAVPASMDLDVHPIVDVSLEPPGDTDPGHAPDASVVRGRLKL